jgi:hypothetical protein
MDMQGTNNTRHEDKTMTIAAPADFAKNHKCDADWIEAVAESGGSVQVFSPGEKVVYAGRYEGVIDSHYRNGMYNVRLDRGQVCADSQDLAAT